MTSAPQFFEWRRTPDGCFDVSERDLAWAAGFMEGEAHFRVRLNGTSAGTTTVGITVSQVDPEPIEKLGAMFGGSIYRRVARPPRQAHSIFNTSGREHSLAIALAIRPFIASARRREQLDRIIAAASRDPAAFAFAEAQRLAELGR